MCNLCSENKGTDQLRSNCNCAADQCLCFCICKKQLLFFHDAAHFRWCNVHVIDFSGFVFRFFFFFVLNFRFLAHLSRRLVGELIVYPWSGVRPSSVVVHNFKHKYLCNRWADHNQILSEASLGWGKDCIRFWARSDQNSGLHGNRKLP